MRFETSSKRKLFARVERLPSGCWVWTGPKNTYGYGEYAAGKRGRFIYAHRVSYVLANGPIPAGMVICHACDNTSCVRPSHLILGTQADNMRDMFSKGRGYVKTRFTDEQVREVRRLHSTGLSRRKIAAHLHASHPTIQAIIEGRTWKHVT